MMARIRQLIWPSTKREKRLDVDSFVTKMKEIRREAVTQTKESQIALRELRKTEDLRNDELRDPITNTVLGRSSSRRTTT